MKTVLVAFIATLWIAVMLAVRLPRQEEPQGPEFKLVEFHLAFLKRGPKWSGGGLSKELQSSHVDHAMSLIESGKAMIAGPVTDEAEIIGVYILRANSAEEARRWVENDPAVKAGYLLPEMLRWRSEDVMKRPATPLKLTTVYLGLLKRGVNWTAEKTAATEELQTAHLANIKRLLHSKKLLLAGPFADNGVLRGLFVFKVASVDEAKEVAETDPAIRAGRLTIELHPWLIPEGILQ